MEQTIRNQKEEYTFVTESDLGLGSGEFIIIRAKDDSMLKVGLKPGEYLIVRKQMTAEPGQLVIAEVDDICTLKRYYPYPDQGIVNLVSGSDEIRTQTYDQDSVTIHGVAVKILKDLAC